MANIDKSEIRICSEHPDYQVPLLWTFAFNGAEFWCPYCGRNYGMLGAGKVILTRQELEERKEKYTKISEDFLHAKGVQVCISTEWNGVQIDPADLPQEEKDRLNKIIKDWKYRIEVEQVA